MSWPAFWAGLGAFLTVVLATVPRALGVAPLVLVVLASVVALACGAVAARVMYQHPNFAAMPLGWRQRVVRWLQVAVAAHWMWLVGFTAHPQWWLGWLLTLGAVSVSAYWFARCHQHILAFRIPDHPVDDRQMRRDDEVTSTLQAALRMTGHTGQEVLGWEPVGSDGVRVLVQAQVQEGKKPAALDAGDAEPIAIALSRFMPSTQLRSSWVRIRREPAAGVSSITVTARDVFADVFPYRDDPAPTSIRVPAVVGYDIDGGGESITGAPVMLRLDRHCQDCGQTESGKSSFINVKWAHITRCTDTCLWVGGTWKLFDAVEGWLDPYWETDEDLPFDLVVNGQGDLLAMLVLARDIADFRQRSPSRQRGGYKTVIVQIDEASYPLRDETTRVMWRGRRHNATDLVGDLFQGAASSLVKVNVASQRSVGHWGSRGMDVSANAGYRTCFMSADPDEVGRLMPGYRNYLLDPPTHRGEYLLNPGEGQPLRVKAPYIQTVDPSKPVLLPGGPTVSDVSWARRHIDHRLDPLTEEVAMQHEIYRDRHRRYDAAMRAYLSSSPEPTAAPETDGYALAMAEADRLVASIAPPGIPQPTRTRKDRIVAVVQAADEPISPADIRASLAEQGDDAGEQVVTNALRALTTEDGRLLRTTRGQYVAATPSDLTNKQTSQGLPV